MASLFDKSLKGIHVPHKKNTENSATQVMPVPKKAYIIMSQHMGPPCDVTVSVGDLVKVGQIVGDSKAFLSAPVHSSVSGTVKSIDEFIMPNGSRSKTVVVETDGLQTLHEDIKKPVINDKEGFIQAVKASGLVGLGGAGFPTHIKFNPKNLDEVDTLIINAAECEPYITSDYRTMMENSEDLIDGIKQIMKFLNLNRCYIGIEDNKPAAIEKISAMIKGSNGVGVVTLKSKYPQGAEKVLIYETTGKVLAEGKLPADIGVIVTNVTTATSLAKYLRDGIPLISKRVTVDGSAINTAKNVEVLIGTPIKEVIEFCGGYKAEAKKMLMGGPMMGTSIYDDNLPILKNNNAILAFDASEVEMYSETACIHCGRCVRACPINLMPLRIESAFERDDIDGLKEFKVNLCMECGCCSYVCPAKRHLVQTNRLAKVKIRKAV